MPEKIQTLKVLSVDDNKLNLLLLSQFLKYIGITSDLAFGGAEAIEKVKDKKYDLIFMDVHMPEVDGFMATKQIRFIDENIIIFGLSADTTENAISKGLNLGMNNYLTKPIHKEKLTQVLNQYFGDRFLKKTS